MWILLVTCVTGNLTALGHCPVPSVRHKSLCKKINMWKILTWMYVQIIRLIYREGISVKIKSKKFATPGKWQWSCFVSPVIDGQLEAWSLKASTGSGSSLSGPPRIYFWNLSKNTASLSSNTLISSPGARRIFFPILKMVQDNKLPRRGMYIID